MAIKRGLMPRFAEVGKIKIGGKGETRKSKDGKDYRLPVRYEHFVVTTSEKDNTDNFIIDQKVMKALGDKPTEIPIKLPFDEIDLNFFTSFQYYHGRKCICQGDGEQARRINKDDVESNVICDPEKCEFRKNEKCKISGILSCYIPASMEVGGVYRFRTHSWNSVSNILATLQYFSDNTNGVLQGLPLKLKFLKKMTAEHGNVNTVTIVLDGIELQRMRELAYQEYENRTKLGVNMVALQKQAKISGFLAFNDDPADVETEFYPPVEEENIKNGYSADDVTAAIQEKMAKPAPETTSEPEKKSEKEEKNIENEPLF